MHNILDFNANNKKKASAEMFLLHALSYANAEIKKSV